MPTFLWVGKSFQYPTTEVPTPAARLDKYCWNSPGNWKILQISGSSLSWQPTDLVPGANGQTASNDFVYVGKHLDTILGWEPAKCPLLFGGFSGGVGAGTWLHTGATSSYGNTYTSALAYFKADLSKGWSFNVRLGEGLTVGGWGLRWARERDTAAAPQYPTTDADYTAAVSSGFRNPANPLRLKVLSNIIFEDNAASWYETPIATTVTGTARGRKFRGEEVIGYLTGNDTAYLGSSLGGNSYSDRGFVFEGVKAYTGVTVSIPIGTGGFTLINAGEAKTVLSFEAGLGQDLKVINGSFKNVALNLSVVPKINVAPWNETIGLGTFVPYEERTRLYQHGTLELNDVVVRDLEYAKCGTVYINGGTAAKVQIHQFPYFCTLDTVPSYTNLAYPDLETNGQYNQNLFRYWNQLPTYVTCGYSGGYVWSDQYLGYTATVPTDYQGSLHLTNRQVSIAGTGVVPGITGPISIEGRIFDDRHYCLYGEDSRTYTETWYYNFARRNPARQRVFVGGKKISSVQPYELTIPTVYMNSAYDDVDEEGKFTEKVMPWQLIPLVHTGVDSSALGTSSLTINTIYNSASMVVPPAFKTMRFKIGQIYLSNHGRLDLTMQGLEETYSDEITGVSGNNNDFVSQVFTRSSSNVFVGSIVPNAGSTGVRLVGGVIMADHTGTLLTSPEYILYNTTIIPGSGTNLRSQGVAGSQWVPFYPTSTST